MSHIGHPLVGDVLYGGKPNLRVMLHSYQVEFYHPLKDEMMSIKKDITFDMKELIKKGGKKK